MRIGILGFPQSGKTTLFNVLARAHAPTGAFASASGGIHVGTVQVPDPRLEALRDLFEPKKYTPARIEYVDLAGPAPSGKGNGTSLLPQQIAASDLILLVVRAFEDPAVAHPRGSVDPRRDVNDLMDELLLKDMAVLEGRLTRVRKAKQVGSKEGAGELELLERCLAQLEAGKPLRELTLTTDEEKLLRGFGLLSAKPLLVVFNMGEDQAAGGGLVGTAGDGAADVLPPAPRRAAVEICGKAEMEIAELAEDEAREFMELLGIAESGLAQVIRKSYELLDLCSFFTVGEDEVRAWNIGRGTPASRAAGAIHSDLERGFIRAEVVASQDLLALGGLSEAKAANKMRVEGRDYVVQDGDVLNVRFSV
jgi:GTP-binding protein YchF